MRQGGGCLHDHVGRGVPPWHGYGSCRGRRRSCLSRRPIPPGGSPEPGAMLSLAQARLHDHVGRGVPRQSCLSGHPIPRGGCLPRCLGVLSRRAGSRKRGGSADPPRRVVEARWVRRPAARKSARRVPCFRLRKHALSERRASVTLSAAEGSRRCAVNQVSAVLCVLCVLCGEGRCSSPAAAFFSDKRAKRGVYCRVES